MYVVYTRINNTHICAYRVGLRLVTIGTSGYMPNGVGQAYH